MPDQDEFAPLATRWKPVHEMILLDKPPQEIADVAFRTLREMLRETGGCPLLSDLAGCLQRFSAALTGRSTIGWRVLAEPERELLAYLDQWSRAVQNRRIDAVAVRSCRIAALEVAWGRFPVDRAEIGAAFATLTANHLLCHFVLDRARAMSVGPYTEQHARQVHSSILQILAPMLERFGTLWIQDPTAQFIMRVRLAPQAGTAAILAHEDDFAFD